VEGLLPMRSRTVLGIALFAVLLAAYLLAYNGEVQASDELSMFCVTHSLVTRGTTTTDAIRWMGLHQGAYGPDGHLYSKYGLGTSLAAAPLVALARLPLLDLGAVRTAALLNSFLTALAGLLLLWYVIQLGYGEGIALAAGLLYGLATLAAAYSPSFFSEPLSALSLLAAGTLLLRFRTTARTRYALLAGAALGVALLTRIANGLVVPLFGAVLLASCRSGRSPGLRRWMVRSWRPALAFTLPLISGALVVAAYNLARFGDPLQTGYHALETFSNPWLEGLVGLLFSPGKGLFLYSPVLILAVASFPAFLRRHRAEALLAGGIPAAYALLYASWFAWHGGHAWGPRFLVPALPFLVLALVPSLTWASQSPWRKLLVGVLALASGLVQVLGVAVRVDRFFDMVMYDWGLPVYDPRLFFDPAYSPLLWQVRLLARGPLAPVWTHNRWLLLPALMLLVLALGTMGWAWRGLGRRGARRLGLALAVTCLVAPLATVALLVRDPRPPRPGYRDLAASLDSLAQPGDAVLLNASTRTTLLLDTLLTPVPVLGLHEEGTLSPASQVALRQYTAAHRRLWLVTDETVPAAELRAWLEARGYRTLAARYSPAALTLYAFPGEQPSPQVLDVTLDGRITLVSGGVAAHATPDEVLPVVVQWRPATNWDAAENLHLLVQLFGTDETLLVQQDWALIQQEETTFRMGLSVPGQVDPGTYRLEARVYRDEDGLRLTAPGGEEAVLLGGVRISGP
jgi:hypothetical protein